MNLKKKPYKDGFLIYREGTNKHAHVPSEDIACALIRYTNRRILMDSKWFRESQRRLTYEKEFKQFKSKAEIKRKKREKKNKKKKKYINIQKGPTKKGA